MKKTAVAIDGPSGAGKSTISKAAAGELGFIYVDTGAMYRAVGYKALLKGYDTKNDTEKIKKMMGSTDIDIRYINGTQNIFLDNINITDKIRSNEVSVAASDVSAIPEVRSALLSLQRGLAARENVIMDGRDIGTYVLPDADVKIFLTASIEDRAKRRYEENMEKGIISDFERLKQEMEYRDKNDSNRKASPLKAADDAIIIDTTGNELGQSVELIINTIKERLK